MSTNEEDLYLQSYPFTTAAAIIGSVDRKVIVNLWDGRTLVGVLRTFDQFGNLVIHDGVERIYLLDKKQYAESEKPRTYLIRGENVVMMVELDIDMEDESLSELTRIDYDSAKKTWKKRCQDSLDKNTEDSTILHDNGMFSAACALY
ncbi:hypothetical protein HII13_002871 [Brettanomyces bruxellensis]|uniref:DEBR0S1_02982g1_1 n=1 Tax=Dekkera bruxellensis TaxID=5007 RepID=A0A7D9CUL0_DEKBR|nr:lsm1p [Brettanomyces bruxellensis AWRI1499]KAF6010758.1 hypothetical protein HII13_002871 [Brettanomyces bruxellensis]KAF6013169.1 hypothetical protein HII12_001884 [Brettanomyces bruxellensis]VUG15915.1 LSM1 [Brettanomyces bruxellensis]